MVSEGASRWIRAFAWACLVNVVLTLIKEVFPPIKGLLAQTGNHWVGQTGIVTLVLVGARALDKRGAMGTACAERLIALSVIGGGLVLFIFYVLHAMML